MFTNVPNAAECTVQTCEAVFGAGCPPINAAPTATPSITGSDCLTQELTGSYVYKDTDTPADLEDTAAVKFQWYTGTDASCSGKAAISGATTNKYTPAAADKGKFICFGVTPTALTGTKQGTEAIAITKAAIDTPVYASVPDKGSSISFETLKGKSADKTLTVTNAGTGTLSISGIAISDVVGDAYGSFEVTPTTADIACPGNKPFTITCKGKEKGTVTATMTVTHNAEDAVCSGCPSGDPTATYPLSCVVTAAPVYSSSPAPGSTLSMTSCTPTDAKTTLTVTNTGSDVLKIKMVTLGGTNKDKFSLSMDWDGAGDFIIPAGEKKVISITGKGSTVGNFTGTLEITHNAAGSPAKYTLSSVISDCSVADSPAAPVNQAPVANKLSVCGEENKPVSVTLSGTDPDVPGMNWFILLIKPITYSVVTQPQHGTLTGTPPNLTYTPAAGYTGADSFTFRMFDGIAYSEPATVSVGTNPAGCLCVNDKYDLSVPCAEYQGVRYRFDLNYAPLASDPTGLYWKLNASTLKNAEQTTSCISVGNDMKLGIPCAVYQGTGYEFVLNSDKPVGTDPFGLYWKMDRSTFKTR